MQNELPQIHIKNVGEILIFKQGWLDFTNYMPYFGITVESGHA